MFTYLLMNNERTNGNQLLVCKLPNVRRVCRGVVYSLLLPACARGRGGRCSAFLFLVHQTPLTPSRLRNFRVRRYLRGRESPCALYPVSQKFLQPLSSSSTERRWKKKTINATTKHKYKNIDIKSSRMFSNSILTVEGYKERRYKNIQDF